MFNLRCIWGLVLVVSCAYGCGQPSQPKPQVEVEGATVDQAGSADGAAQPPEVVAPPLPDVSKIAYPDPPSPPGFSGDDVAEDAPIPTEIQEKIRNFETTALERVEFLKHPHPGVRMAAADRLSFVRDEERKNPDTLAQVILGLRSALKDPNAKVRKEAVSSLAEYKQEAKSATQELVTLLADEDSGIVYNAVGLLKAIGPYAAPATPALLPWLRQDDVSKQRDALEIIGSFGPDAKIAIPHIRAYLAADGEVANALEALGKLDDVESILKAIQSSNRVHQIFGMMGAVHLTTFPPELTAELIEAATTPSDETSVIISTNAHAAKALAKVRPTTEPIVAAIAAVCKHPVPDIRAAAVEALGNIDPQLPSAKPLLLAAADDDAPQVKQRATEALAKMQTGDGSELEVIFKQVLEQGTIDPLKERNGYRPLPNAYKFYPDLMKWAQDPEGDEVRRAAALQCVLFLAEALQRDEPTWNDEVLAAARTLLDDESNGPTLSAAAASAIHSQRQEHPRLEAAFLKGLEEAKFLAVRRACASYLANAQIKEAIPGLIAAASSDDPAMVKIAISALSKFGDDAAPAIPVLLELAAKPETPDRSAVLEKIEYIAMQPDISVPILAKLAADENEGVQGAALKAWAAYVVKHKTDAAPLIAILKKQLVGEPQYRIYVALEATARLGEHAAPLAPEVTPWLDSKSENFPRTAAIALGAIGPAAKDAAPALVAKAGEWEEPYYAILALTNIQHAPGFAKVAEKLMEKVQWRPMTLKALQANPTEAALILPAIIKVLDSTESEHRHIAIETLGAIGPPAKEAVPALKKQAAGDNDWLRTAAVEALVKIAPDDPEVKELKAAAEKK